MKLPLIVFDVNQTLLDLESLTPTFERIFGELSALRRGSLSSYSIQNH